MRWRPPHSWTRSGLTPGGLAACLLALMLTTGCQVALHEPAPAGWQRVEGPDLSDGDTPLLQVMTTHDATAKHTAMRVVVPGRGALVWDPTGNMGVDSVEMTRERAVVRARPPAVLTLEAWLAERWRGHGEELNEVFEWRVTEADATRIYDRLDASGRGEELPDGFRSSVALGCARSVSRFLDSYAQDVVGGPVETRILPSSFARDLWGHGPDRVLRVRQADGVWWGYRPVAAP